MDCAFGEQGSGTTQAPKSLLAGLAILVASLIKWLASLINLTEEEKEEAGIYLGRLGGE